MPFDIATPATAPGVYAGLSNAAYHGGPGISKSGLDLVRRSPLHYRAARDAGPREPTADMRLGTVAHDLILEGATFWDRYAIPLDPADFPNAIHSKEALVDMVEVLNLDRLPKLPSSGSKQELVDRIREVLNSAAGTTAIGARGDLDGMKIGDLKAIIAEINVGRQGLLSTRGTQRELAAILAEHGQVVELWADLVEMNRVTNDGKTIITQQEFEQVSAMRDAVMAHPVAGKLLDHAVGEPELSCYWTDDATGALCRCRPDFWRRDGIIVDLKTSRDASPGWFPKSISGFRYHVQEAFYRDGIGAAIKQGAVAREAPKAFLFVAVEKTAPYAVAVYRLDSQSVDIGRREYRDDLDAYAAAEKSGVWPGYGDVIQPTGLPEWRLRQEEMGEAA